MFYESEDGKLIATPYVDRDGNRSFMIKMIVNGTETTAYLNDFMVAELLNELESYYENQETEQNCETTH